MVQRRQSPEDPASPPPAGYLLRIELQWSSPPIWRSLALPADLTLRDLHHAIQIAMGWEDSHLHQFRIGDRLFADPIMLEDRDSENESTTTLAKLLGDGRGDRGGGGKPPEFLYEYDFGDGWLHVITLEDTIADAADPRLPGVVDGRRACPPEDCGGIPGYQSLLEAIADPSHPDHAEMVDYYGTNLDPEAFDLTAADRNLRRRFASPRRRKSKAAP